MWSVYYPITQTTRSFAHSAFPSTCLMILCIWRCSRVLEIGRNNFSNFIFRCKYLITVISYDNDDLQGIRPSTRMILMTKGWWKGPRLFQIVPVPPPRLIIANPPHATIRQIILGCAFYQSSSCWWLLMIFLIMMLSRKSSWVDHFGHFLKDGPKGMTVLVFHFCCSWACNSFHVVLLVDYCWVLKRTFCLRPSCSWLLSFPVNDLRHLPTRSNISLWAILLRGMIGVGLVSIFLREIDGGQCSVRLLQ